VFKQGIKASGKLRLRVLEGDSPPGDTQLLQSPPDFEIEAPGVEGYIIGRSDISSTYIPDIDLVIFQGQQKGISRRHAALVRSRGRVHVIDLDSINGTFINGTRLSPNIAYPLNEGDQISLANLHLVIAIVSGD
jgi:pSer/pThr/pTyr-binding forkhead associated (FHA) protein